VNFTSYDNVNQFLVSLNGILQSPTDSFTVSGSTLTFASNLSTGDVIDFVMVLGNTLDVGTPSDNTVSLAKLTATGTKSSSTFLRGDNTFDTPPLGGITEADMWRLTADITANTDPISSNLERVDDASFAKIGTGMTVSSGIWSFPVTGLYQVTANATMASNGDDNVAFNIYVTLDNSSYDHVANAWSGTDGGGGAGTNTASAVAFVNVTNVSNVKVKFTVTSIGTGSSVLSSSDVNYTYFNFIRLGDSQ